jgi:HlyD family secretion protein
MKLNKSTIVFAVPVVVVLIAVVVLVVRAALPDRKVLTGIIETTEIDIASKIPGRIDSLFVTEGMPVHRGEVLAVLSSKEIDAKVGQARGAMDAARAKLQMARNGARPEEREGVEKLYLQAKHQFELAEKTWGRIQSMYKDSVISAQEHDQVQFQYRSAKEQLDAAKAKYQMVQNGTRIEELHGAEALARQAENAYNEALAYQQETRIVSPADGEISKRIVERGEIVAGGYPVMTVLNPDDSWIVLQLREDLMTSIHKGSKLAVTIPALGTETHTFTISYVAAMADFATWRATNQKGDFDLKTFEIRLRPDQPVHGLRPGMTARVTL